MHSLTETATVTLAWPPHMLYVVAKTGSVLAPASGSTAGHVSITDASNQAIHNEE